MKHRLTAAHFAIYAILRGRDWRRGLTPATNTNKVNNGYLQPIERLKVELRWAQPDKLLDIFVSTVDPAMLNSALETLTRG